MSEIVERSAKRQRGLRRARGVELRGEVRNLLREDRDRGSYTQREVIAAVRECRGLWSHTADRLGTTVMRLRWYAKRHASVRVAFAEARAEALDTAESGLWTAVEHGARWAIVFALKELGRERGFGQPEQVSGTVTHEHIHVWKERLQAAHTALEERRAQSIPTAFAALSDTSGAILEPEETA